MDINTVLVSFSSFVVLSLIFFYGALFLKELKTGDGKPIISLFLKELGSKATEQKSPPAWPDIDVSKESDLPDGWFADEKVFSLEKRAIFSKV